MMIGARYSERQRLMSDADSTSTEFLPLHVALANHLENCSECLTSLGRKPIGLGQTTQLCSRYQAIIKSWAEKEGEVNNIVAHDEFGNQASTVVHDTYPEAWRP